MSRLAIISLSILLFSVKAYAKPIYIKLIDLSTPYSNGTEEWGPQNYAFAEQALSNQLAAVGQYYNSKRGFSIVGFGATQRGLRVFIKNQCVWFNGQAYPSFHWIDSSGPYACVASINGGGFWWMTRAIEHETTEMIGDPTGRGREIVDPVAAYFGGMFADGFNFDYLPDDGDYPFADFLLPRKAAKYTGFSDYLAQVPLK
ncbi:MAG TPA: hypothetical protein VMU41_09755 [Candidatus Binataceae bacterium]|nr:hypothetical protein [Candidatus Binataceae bacterium]